MSLPDAAATPQRPPAPKPGFFGHIARIALICGVLLAGTFAGALVSAFAGRRDHPFAGALGRADDISEPMMVVAALAVVVALVRVALGEGTTRRRRLVALRHEARSWGRLAPLLWIPAILIVVFGEGWLLLLTLAAPAIVIGLTWIGERLSAFALDARPLTYATVAVLGLALGLFG